MPSINFTSGIIRTPFAPGSVLSKQPRGGTFIGPLSLLNIFLSVVTRTVDNCETPCMRSGELSLSFVTATRCHCKSPILQLMKFSKCTDDYLWKLTSYTRQRASHSGGCGRYPHAGASSRRKTCAQCVVSPTFREGTR